MIRRAPQRYVDRALKWKTKQPPGKVVDLSQRWRIGPMAWNKSTHRRMISVLIRVVQTPPMVHLQTELLDVIVEVIVALPEHPPIMQTDVLDAGLDDILVDFSRYKTMTIQFEQDWIEITLFKSRIEFLLQTEKKPHLNLNDLVGDKLTGVGDDTGERSKDRFRLITKTDQTLNTSFQWLA